MEPILLLIPLLLFLVIVIRLGAGSFDRGRVERYVAEQGGRVLHIVWAPFGPGWYGEKGDRIYEVRYLDKEGNEHRAHCKTSALSGVYFTKDEIVRYAQPQEPRGETLEEENRRLREELERLRGERN